MLLCVFSVQLYLLETSAYFLRIFFEPLLRCFRGIQRLQTWNTKIYNFDSSFRICFRFSDWMYGYVDMANFVVKSFFKTTKKVFWTGIIDNNKQKKLIFFWQFSCKYIKIVPKSLKSPLKCVLSTQKTISTEPLKSCKKWFFNFLLQKAIWPT